MSNLKSILRQLVASRRTLIISVVLSINTPVLFAQDDYTLPVLFDDFWSGHGYSARNPRTICNNIEAELNNDSAPNRYELLNITEPNETTRVCEIHQTIVYPSGETDDGGVLDFYMSKQPTLACPMRSALEVDFVGDGDIDICVNQKSCPVKVQGNPIDCENGQKTQTDVVYQGAGSDPLTYKISYSSEEYIADGNTFANRFDTHLGAQRGDNQFRKIELVYQNEEGRVYLITYKNGFSHIFYGGHTNTTFESNLVESGPLTLASATGLFTQRKPNGDEYQFLANGMLDKKTDKSGRVRTYEYTEANLLKSITNHFGDKLQFAYGTNGLVEQLTAPDGRHYLFSYDAHNNLTKVTYPDDTLNDLTDNPTTEYLFENANFPNHLTAKVDENGTRYATWSYDEFGRAISSEHGVGIEKVVLDYTVENQTRVTTHISDILTSDLIYHYKLYKRNGETKKLLHKEEFLTCTDCETGTIEYEYDLQDQVSSIVSQNGTRTNYTFVDKLLTEKVLATGTPEETTITQEWDQISRRLLSSSRGRLKVEYGYDSYGNTISTTKTDLDSNEIRTITKTYNTDGLLESINGYRTDVSDVTNFTYDLKGNLHTITNALNQVTTLENYDANGRPQKITDANGVETVLTYTPRGWLKSSQTGTALTEYFYTASGNVSQINTPTGSSINYQYDAGQRLVGISDSLGNQINYQLNAFGNREATTITDEQGLLTYSQSNVFNALGQLHQSLGNNGQSYTTSYDKEGNLISSTDALHKTTSFSFDALNRLRSEIDATTGETKIDFTTQDQISKVTDAEGKETDYSYNAFGNLLRLVSEDSGDTTYTYDNSGNVLTKKDARGITSSFSYDALNRLLSITYPDSSLNISYEYDSIADGNFGVGRLTKLIDKTGSTDYKYNSLGLLISETKVINSNTYITGFNYDSNGQLQSIVYPSGALINYVYDTLGRIERVSATLNQQQTTLVDNAKYLPFGPIKSYVFGNALSENISYDSDYRLTSKQIIGLTDNTYTHDVLNNITSVNGLIDLKNYQYDSLSRLIQSTGNSEQQEFTYNLVGDRLTKVDNGATETYFYGGAGGGSDIPDLVSEYKFDSNLEDSVTGSATSQLNNGAAYNSGVAGDALDFSATNAHAVLDVPNGLGDNGELTISFWMKLDSAYGKFFIAGRGKYWNADDIAFFCFYTRCGIYGYSSTGSRKEAKVTYTSYEGEWQLWTGRLKNGVLDFYLNGQLMASVGGVKNPVDTYSFTVGANYQPRYGMSGSMDELQIYNRALSDEEIATLAESSPPPVASASNHLTSVEGISTTGYSYDANGNVIQKGDITFSYDDTNRMISSSNNGTSSTYMYNAKGERTAKISGGVETHYIYGPDGKLIAEANDQGTVIKEYVYFNNQPLAQIIGSNIYYYHNSHLGTPESMTDVNQNIVWQASHTPFGKATVSIDTIENNIRFPGQYFDAESGLHYNYFRDYDPEIGRYIQSDPIGLAGGINTYGYVGGNPVNYVDPNGLFGINPRTAFSIGRTIGNAQAAYVATQAIERARQREALCQLGIGYGCYDPNIYQDEGNVEVGPWPGSGVDTSTGEECKDDKECRRRQQSLISEKTFAFDLWNSSHSSIGPEETRIAYQNWALKYNRRVSKHNAACPNHRVSTVSTIL
jgi:RHS repeat-associated protein